MIRACTVGALALLAFQPPQQPSFRTGVEVVEIDVSVMRGNQPVQGLTSRDFGLGIRAIAPLFMANSIRAAR